MKSQWGTLRDSRNPEREKVVADMRQFVQTAKATRGPGALVFRKVCGQCHKIYGEGQDVGPDITANGRSRFRSAALQRLRSQPGDRCGLPGNDRGHDRGRSLTGILVEDNSNVSSSRCRAANWKPSPRREIEEVTVSKVSLMPEGLEKQMQPQEIADLFAFLVLDRPPTDPKGAVDTGDPTLKGACRFRWPGVCPIHSQARSAREQRLQSMPYPLFNRSRLRIQPLADRVHDLDLSVLLPLDAALPSFEHPALPILGRRLVEARQRGTRVS